MTQEDKELLLKDLCARLPYSSQVVYNGITETLSTLHIFDMTHIKNEYVDIKPYLRPMSSMTVREKYDYVHMTAFYRMDFCYEHHLDCRRLIEKGLALEAPEGMYNS